MHLNTISTVTIIIFSVNLYRLTESSKNGCVNDVFHTTYLYHNWLLFHSRSSAGSSTVLYKDRFKANPFKANQFNDMLTA